MAELIPTPTRRERQRDTTRTLIFQAALDEFRRSGFDRASISRIAREAGVSRPSFYFHFPTKAHVLLELQRVLSAAVVERLEGCTSLRETLRAFAEALVESEARVGDPDLHRDMCRILVRGLESISLEEEEFPLRDVLARRFAEGAASGELRAGLDPEQANHVFLTSIFGFLIGARKSDHERRADLRALVSLYLEEGQV